MAGDVPSPSPNPGPADVARPGVPVAPLALYRRYRPASFAEVRGQDHVTEPLRQALRSGRVHHAYLFSGPRGCGKTSSARILARSLNCELGPTPDPCGTCASCVALAPTGPGSIDVIEIDAASHGGVDDARDLRERAFYAPVSGRFKIYIIDEAHMVTREGFNALLKLVEEPPPHLKFVFATTEPEKVIATIRSRTHHYPFRLVPPAVLRELLEEILGSEEVAYEPAVLPVVIRAGAGSVRDSLSVLDQLIAGSDESGLSYDRAVALLGYTDDALLDEVALAFAEGDGAAVFHSIDRVVEAGHDPRRFAADLLDRFRDLIVLAAVPDAAASGLLDVPADRLDRMREQAAGFGQAQLASAAETISAGLVEMRGATSPRLLLELMCAQVLLPAPGTGEQALLARIDRLERRLESSTGLAAPAGAARGRATASPGVTASPGTPASRAAASPGPAAASPGAPAPAAAAAPGPAASGDSGDRHEPPRPRRSAEMAEAGGPPSRPGSALQPERTQTGGPVGTDLLRERWPDVLDAVKSERKVAWLLLSNATVDSLADGILTLRFGREGEARGFSGSGYDRELGQVLKAMFGIMPQIRAIAGTAQGQHSRGHARQGDAAPSHPQGEAGQGGTSQGAVGQSAVGQSAAGGGHEQSGQDGTSQGGRGGTSQGGRGGTGRGGNAQAGNAQGPAAQGPAAQGLAAQGHAAQSHTASDRTASGSGAQSGQGQGGAQSGQGQGSAQSGQGQGGAQSGQGQGSAGPGRAADDVAGQRAAGRQGTGRQGSGRRGQATQARAAAGEPATAGTGPRSQARRDGAGQGEGNARNGEPSRASMAMAHGSRPEPGPDTADVTDADALSGLDLIQRELGGQIIEEIGEP